MLTYIIRRLLLAITTFFLVTLMAFFLIRLIPGNIIDLMVEDQFFTTGMDRAAVEHALGLDVPMHIQYGRWIGGIVRGDFGNSLWRQTPVSDEMLARLPITLELGMVGILIGLLISIPVGVYSGIRQDTWGDYMGRSLAILLMAVPGFWVGTMVMVLPSVFWGWSPPMQYIPFSENPIGNLQILIIPGTILGTHMSGMTMRMMRTMMLEVLRQDYIRTAWAKGLKESVVIMRHALKNALIPVVTLVGLQVPILIGGSVIIEQIFNLPGMGRLLMEALGNRDFIVIMGIMVVMSVWVLLANLFVDLTYAYLDPRIHYE